MKEALRRIYGCSDKDLYEILLAAWENFAEKQDKFVKFKGIFTDSYRENAVQKILAARALPNATARYADAEKDRLIVVENGGKCTGNFKSLKSYIKRAFKGKALQKIHFDEAGQADFTEAGKENWPSVGEMNQTMLNYITKYETQLTAGTNMPADFKEKCTTDSTEFAAIFSHYKKAMVRSEQTKAKITANNDIYETGIEMLTDGQLIFAGQEDILVKFTFSSLWDLISPPVSGVKGAVMTADFKTVPFAEIAVEREGQPIEFITCDENGAYERRMAAGPVKMTVTAEGMESETIEETINMGSYKSFDFVLKAA